MQGLIAASFLLLWCHAAAGLRRGRTPNDFRAAQMKRRDANTGRKRADHARVAHAKRDLPSSRFATNTTKKFAVDGTKIPEVRFDAGESYAGRLPIGNSSDSELFFWFWPTTAPGELKEIIIWLNGGPGCSSLGGLLEENGPISWQIGTHGPVSNPWSWHRLSNIVYIDQPVGTGYSKGPISVRNEEDVSKQFMGFWKNFVDLFQLQGYKVYLTGESYAGMYCPYIASYMLDEKDKTHFDVAGMMILDPLITEAPMEITLKPFLDYWAPAFPFNDNLRSYITNMSRSCGYDDYRHKYFTFPANGPQPSELPGMAPDLEGYLPDCDLFDSIYEASMSMNPGFSIYQVSQLPPLLDDPLGAPTTIEYLAPGQQLYFNRTDVKSALHVPDADWSMCRKGVFVEASDATFGDESPLSAHAAIPKVIDATKNVMIAQGVNDLVIPPGRTLLAIQNMTFGGGIGFKSMPTDPLFVPLHPMAPPQVDIATAAGQGVMGTVHTERGLTWVNVVLAGHMIPSSQPAVAFRQVEVLLGRVKNLSSTQPLSIYPDVEQPSADRLGRGTAPMFGRLLNDTTGSSRGGVF